MLERLELNHVGPSPQIALEFGSRLNFLTGDNGVGKSAVLDAAWWALTDVWAGSPLWPPRDRPGIATIRSRSTGNPQVDVLFDNGSESWISTGGQFIPDRATLVIYAQVDGAIAIWDPARPLEHSSFSPRELWEGYEHAGTRYCNGLISDMVTWQLRRNVPFQLLERALETLSPSPQEKIAIGDPTRLSSVDAREYPTLRLPYGSIPVIHISAALKRVLGLAYALVWTWHEHEEVARLGKGPPANRIVWLIDEVESHLHPQWQRMIVPALLEVIRGLRPDTAVQVIATTHAPLVLASVEPAFDVDRDRLFHFELHDRAVTVTNVPWAKQGDAVGWLTSDVFGLKQARSREAEQAIRAANAVMRGDPSPVPGLDTRDAIHKELLRVLPEDDPFWPRWEVQRLGAARP